MQNIERAILSVSDKTGILELAQALTARGVEILSTGGTAKHLADAGVPVTPIAQWSGAPEILGGRVKTLTPKVFGAILHDRANDAHLADVARLGIPRVDLVVVNLYPFESTIAKEGVTLAEAVEQIDIGGPSMLRAAAKNHRHVLPLCDPSLYADFLREFEGGAISDEFRLRCAIRVFEKTSAYDATIASYLGGNASLSLQLDKFQDLRYGENPHQSAGFYVRAGERPFAQLQGKELSYNNLLDLDSAIRLANAFGEPAAAVIKHTNPCGVARRDTLAEALRAAIEADPVSAFGGIIGANRTFDGDCARAVAELFLEVIVAPEFDDEARELLAKKKNLRLVTTAGAAPAHELRSAAGGILMQSTDRLGGRDAWKVVTERQPTSEELDGLEFAWIVCAHVKSNAIVLTRQSQSSGIGAGQMSRVDAAKVAIMKSLLGTDGTFAASDAFFPFRDGLDLLADAGVRAVIQPGGSVRDVEVIAAANERGLTMVFTGERHFRH
ncbi:MAG: bifunctional phosphoribosylaminoimidazolecarboxamide formyltransferase/IMP cyclohydrolase [Acidobacteria bacterium]|nr:bifunctional phosphoribosylaminoimidazolecarboxamide formyltransferase/IMP cyclohydrolase [Acidobacteriota bacterium]MBV9476887.1 bifunctional phosphoribosylaminoimidazolecarboxamide formyltransferase/IMP cyclohydrolase [Acidobacteriota bacterium]